MRRQPSGMSTLAGGTVCAAVAARHGTVGHEEQAVGHGEGTSWKEAFVSWGSSFLLHAGVFLLTLFAVFAVRRAVGTGEEGERAPVTGGIVDTGRLTDVGGRDWRVSDGGPRGWLEDNLQNRLNLPKTGEDPFGSPDKVSKAIGGPSVAELSQAIFAGAGAGVHKGLGGEGLGTGVQGGLARYHPTKIGLFDGDGKGTVPGDRGMAARRIVYVLDHSGSMLEPFDFLRQETKRRVDSLLPIQQFAVVVFSETVEVLGPGTLQRGFPEVKQEVCRRVDRVRAEGQNDELLEPFQVAMEKAFAMKPQLIIFLTDGKFNPKLLGVVDRLNADHKVAINTIAFVQHDPVYEELLKQLAQRNGGLYKFVSYDDLVK